MGTIFDSVIMDVWPDRLVRADDICITFATIEPIPPSHVLVVLRTTYNAWTDAPSDVATYLMTVVHTIGPAQKAMFGIPRAGLVIVRPEVPHAYLHVIPLRDETDILLPKAALTNGEEIDSTITTLRKTPLSTGHGRHVPPSVGPTALV